MVPLNDSVPLNTGVINDVMVSNDVVPWILLGRSELVILDDFMHLLH